MPIYEYQCNHCGHKLETIQKVSDQPLQRCPVCETDALRKLVSAAAFRLKGSGWYETDFKNKGRPAAKKDGDGKGNGADSGSVQKDGKKDDATTAKGAETPKTSNTAPGAD